MKLGRRERADLARLAVLLFVALAALVAGGAARSGSTAASACKPKATKAVRTYCGAKASVTANGKTYAFRNGRCDLYPTYVSVTIGAFVRKGSTFALLVGRGPDGTPDDPTAPRAGAYTTGTIAVAVTGYSAVVHNAPDLRITLTNGRRAGTFSATVPANAHFQTQATPISGSFTCGGR